MSEQHQTGRARGARQRTDFADETIQAHGARLGDSHLTVLMSFSALRDYKAVAEALNLPLGTVKSRLNRARLKLSALVAEAERKHPNGAPMFAPDGTMLDDEGNRSIFDDVDE